MRRIRSRKFLHRFPPSGAVRMRIEQDGGPTALMTISGIDIHFIRDGKMAEHWHLVEELQMLRQWGLVPAPEEVLA